jgi:hypothetical protein
MSRNTLVLVILLTCGVLSACANTSRPPVSSAPKTGDWLGYASVVEDVVEFIHDGTGRLLNKNQVRVERVGSVREVVNQDGLYVADYRITVTESDNSFSTTASDVPCDKDGIPTDASVDRIREAVEEIKRKIDRLQN